MNIRNVLFPTDFSETATRAGRIAADMALAAHARLHLLHVVAGHADASEAAARIGAESAALVREGIETESTLLSGRAAAEIVRYASEHAIDLIVIGTHGRTGLSRALLGSVAEAVVRLAPCLVLSVPAAHVAAGAAAPAPAAAVAASAAAEAPGTACLVCAKPTADLICAACRDRIRGEALEAKRSVEQAGRRGQPA